MSGIQKQKLSVMTNSQLFINAHAIAKTLEGDYKARFSYALTVAHAQRRAMKAKKVFVSSERVKEVNLSIKFPKTKKLINKILTNAAIIRGTVQTHHTGVKCRIDTIKPVFNRVPSWMAELIEAVKKENKIETNVFECCGYSFDFENGVSFAKMATFIK